MEKITTCFKDHPVHGKCLYADNGKIEIGIPLSFGIRIAHLSFVGEKNVFFEQPLDAKVFTTEDGWRLRGGHRLWLAPESEKDYHPDNDAIEYGIEGEKIILTQKPDPRLKVKKSIEISFEGDAIRIVHRILNVSDEPIGCSLWALSVMAPGGVETIPLPQREGSFSPLWHLTSWDYTNLGDDRLKFEKEKITITHKVRDTNLKLGISHPAGEVTYVNGGVVFTDSFEIDPSKPYTDTGASFETFFSAQMAEIESLSPFSTVPPSGTKEHTEVLRLKRQ
ncbi:MAG: hypothetical protein IJV00_07120 [Clostridia bacterium]|nr:hypothetical protein [Clostridia bacterium]